MFRLDEKNVLLTGAAGHLGRSMAKALADAGALVWLNGRRRPALEALRDEIVAQGGQAEVADFDVTNEDAIDQGIARIEDRSGRLDGIVNNAYNGATGTLETVGAARFAGEVVGRLSNTLPGGYAFFDNPNFVKEFAKRNTVRVWGEREDVIEISLAGTAKAINAVLACQKEQPKAVSE